MQNNVYGAYILKAGSNFFTWDRVGLLLGLYQKGLSLSQWSPSWRQYESLVGNQMEHVPIIISLSTQQRVRVYTNLNLD